jgi:hypothetical protein
MCRSLRPLLWRLETDLSARRIAKGQQVERPNCDLPPQFFPEFPCEFFFALHKNGVNALYLCAVADLIR